MARTHNKHVRAYVSGVDMSGYTRSVGAMTWSFGAQPDAALTDGCKNILIGQGDIQFGTLNAFLDNDTAGLFANKAQGLKTVSIAIGNNAAPVAGDPVFSWEFEDVGYQAQQGDGFVTATLTFAEPSYASTLTYRKPWGYLLHASGAETAVNTATGVDDNGASSALGGLFWYHMFSSNGTATIKAQHAATNSNGSFADLTLATSGVVDASVTPKHDIIALSTSLTVNRYTRWQIVLGTATTLSFVCGLIRNNLA